MTAQTRNKIRTLRELKGYSQDFMAEKLNVSQKTYSRLESGHVKLDIARLKEISEVLEVEPSALLDNEANIFNNYSKAKNFGNIYVSSQEYIDYLTQENKRLQDQVDRLMTMLENRK